MGARLREIININHYMLKKRDIDRKIQLFPSQYHHLLTAIILLSYFSLFIGHQNVINSNMSFLEFTAHYHLCCVFSMDINGVVDSIKGFVGSYFFSSW